MDTDATLTSEVLALSTPTREQMAEAWLLSKDAETAAAKEAKAKGKVRKDVADECDAVFENGEEVTAFRNRRVKWNVSEYDAHAHGKILEGLLPHLTPELRRMYDVLKVEHTTPVRKLGFVKV